MEDQTEKKEKLTRQSLSTGFRVLIKYLSQYKRDIIMLSVIGLLSAIGNGVVPYIAGKFFDAIITPGTVDIAGHVMPFYTALLIIWAIVQLITYILDWRIQIKSEYLSNYIWLDYMAKGFGFLVNLPMAFHKTNKIGEIGSKINNAAGSLEIIAGRIVIDLAPQMLSIVIALVIGFTLKPLLAFFLLAGVVLYAIIVVREVQPLSAYQKEYYDKVFSVFYGDAFDMIGNTMAIKQATAEKYEQEKIANNAKQALPLWMRLAKAWGALSLYQRIIILGTQILIFSFSIYYINTGSMTLGELLAFNAYAAMIFGPFMTIARNWQTIHNGIINIQETEKILSLPTENYEPHGSVEARLNGDIVFENVNFQYEEGKKVLQDISFSVKAGDVIALVGESGVGKSTLIDLLSAYHFPSSGKILVDGKPIETLNLRSFRSQIAVVPQEVVLFNDTIKTNVKYGNFSATDEEMEVAAKKAYATDFINKFPDKWNQIVGERGIKLSVGQKQRVAIARAILRNPRILILDEPTAALDAGSEKIITDSLDELMAGKTTFIIAHRLSTVRKANKILVFKEGKLIETGTHGDLVKMENGEYRRLYELQIGLHG
ncbi:MAG: ABC transporter ATP-binding protein [Candidatus Paceibacterota bacterium]|jgi:ABC-type multidrug transport system fused ATPase/permease subunit